MEQGAGRAEPEVGSQMSEVGKSGELEVKSKGIRAKREELRETQEGLTR